MAFGISIQLDGENDFSFNSSSNTFDLVKGVPNCIQAIKILLGTLKGEIQLYPEFGVDIPQLLDKNVADDNIKHAISNALRRDPRIKAVDKITLARSNHGRTLNISVKATTYEGAILEFREDVVW